MRNLDESPLLEKPDLVEIKVATVDKRRLSEFTLKVQLTRQTAEDSKKAVVGSAGTQKDKKP
jgi:type IV pilus assembly protein PilN